MLRHVRNSCLALFVFAVIVAPVCVAAGVDYVGVRVILPLGQMPVMIGIEVGTRVSFGWVTACLLLTPAGRTLLLGGIEMALTDQESPGSSFIRATVGVSYFDFTARFPSLVLGAGIAYRLSIEDAFQVGIRGEIIYPLALGPPLVSIGSGWAP